MYFIPFLPPFFVPLTLGCSGLVCLRWPSRLQTAAFLYLVSLVETLRQAQIICCGNSKKLYRKLVFPNPSFWKRCKNLDWPLGQIFQSEEISTRLIGSDKKHKKISKLKHRLKLNTFFYDRLHQHHFSPFSSKKLWKSRDREFEQKIRGDSCLHYAMKLNKRSIIFLANVPQWLKIIQKGMIIAIIRA